MPGRVAAGRSVSASSTRRGPSDARQAGRPGRGRRAGGRRRVRLPGQLPDRALVRLRHDSRPRRRRRRPKRPRRRHPDRDDHDPVRLHQAAAARPPRRRRSAARRTWPRPRARPSPRRSTTTCGDITARAAGRQGAGSGRLVRRCWPRTTTGSTTPVPPSHRRCAGHLRAAVRRPDRHRAAERVPATTSASRTSPRTTSTRAARWRWPASPVTRTATATSSSSSTRTPRCRSRGTGPATPSSATVTSGMDIVDKIAKRASTPATRPLPLRPISILTVDVRDEGLTRDRPTAAQPPTEPEVPPGGGFGRFGRLSRARAGRLGIPGSGGGGRRAGPGRGCCLGRR